jgi:F0F1-type ATP synthase membrane subunit b/b'
VSRRRSWAVRFAVPLLGLLLLTSLAGIAVAQTPPVSSPSPAVPRPSEHGRQAKEEANTNEAEDEAPEAINWVDFTNKKQPPYAAMFLNFGILAFLYYRFGKKPVAEALVKHRASVAKEIEEAQRMKHEAEARAKTYQAKLKDLETELSQTKLALEEAGKGERDRIIKEAEEKAVRMQKDAAFMLEQEAKQARLDLQRETVAAALAAAEEILRKRVTPSDQERLAEEFLTSLDKPSPGRARAGGPQ